MISILAAALSAESDKLDIDGANRWIVGNEPPSRSRLDAVDIVLADIPQDMRRVPGTNHRDEFIPADPASGVNSRIDLDHPANRRRAQDQLFRLVAEPA